MPMDTCHEHNRCVVVFEFGTKGCPLCAAEEALRFIKAYREHFPNIAQLLDGWHADTAWTEWDENIRKEASTLGKWADEILSTGAYKRSKEVICPDCGGIKPSCNCSI